MNRAILWQPSLPIKTQDFSENENEDHADEDPRLAHESTYALCMLANAQVIRDLSTYSVSNDTNCVACSQTRQADRETSAHMHEPSEQRVLLLRRGLDVAGDKDGDDEGVDGQDTGHDNGDKRLDSVSQSSNIQKSQLAPS